MINLTIEELRKKIDGIDEEILANLARRKAIVREIADFKKSMSIPVPDKGREKFLLDKIKNKAKENGLNGYFIDSIYSLIFENSKIEQERALASNSCKIREIGIIGFGRFGRLMADYLLDDFKIYVFDKENKKTEQKNVYFSSLKEVCKKRIVVLVVPISEIESVLNNIKNLLGEGALVIDTCSVKELPAKLMKKILPKNVQILATHPLFGPDTASDSLAGRKIALCRVRVDDEPYSQAKSFLKSKGLLVIETTPQKHDEQIARSLVLTHFIGRALIEMGAKDMEIDTRGYRDLIRILETVRNDSWQLFEDMNSLNSHSKKARDDFRKALGKVSGRLEK